MATVDILAVEAARALAQTWADSAHWRKPYHEHREYARDEIINMFGHMVHGIDAAAVRAALLAHPVPRKVSDRDAWVKDAAGRVLVAVITTLR